MPRSNKIFFLLLLLVCFTTVANAQTILIRHAHKDTAYIREFYRRHLIIRAYESTKFNNFKLIDGPNKLVYKPNTHDVLGLGFNYKFLALNFGLYVPALGKSPDTYGKTRQLDIQTHVYYHKFIVDLYAQYYKGYYLSNGGATLFHYNNGLGDKRSDINTKDLSVVVQYVFNDQKFSYNAAFYQNERQKKSAGSFIVGAGIYHFDTRGDSALTPSNVSYTNFFNDNPFNRMANTAIGVNGGYGYTLVIKKLFFVTASLSAGLGGGITSETNTIADARNSRFGLSVNTTTKFAAGYNSDKYFVGINYIRLTTENNGVEAHTWQEVNLGNFRFIVAKRFRPRKALIPKNGIIEVE